MGLKLDNNDKVYYNQKFKDKVLKSYFLKDKSSFEVAKEFNVDIDLIQQWAQDFLNHISDIVNKNEYNETEDVPKLRVKNNNKVIQYIMELYCSIEDKL
ncbi:MAG: hypothetical protein LBT38_02870 [Deltaproteobacteria bacterium]|jgi:transposase-like protein|nr:hypothetical protein [Deltaproteobacteria bacterium]